MVIKELIDLLRVITQKFRELHFTTPPPPSIPIVKKGFENVACSKAPKHLKLDSHYHDEAHSQVKFTDDFQNRGSSEQEISEKK